MQDDPPLDAPPPGRAKFALEVILVRLRFLAIFVAVGVVAGQWERLEAYAERWTRPAPESGGAASTTEHFCPMHPEVVREGPASCPICGMPLSRRAKGAKVSLPEGVLARVQLSPYRVAQAGVRTVAVAPRPLVREVAAVGFVEVDERREKRLAARFPGRVEEVLADFTGRSVAEGDPLVRIFSPELAAAGEALRASARSLGELRASGAAAAERERAERAFASARERLVLWGLGADEVDRILREDRVESRATVRAPLSGTVLEKRVVQGQYVMEGDDLYRIADLGAVWIRARFFAADLEVVAVGREAVAVVEGLPGATFPGKVSFVDPVVDPATRTVGVRLELANPDGRLRPGMYATATVRVPVADLEPFASRPRPAAPAPGGKRTDWWCPMHPEVTAAEPGKECAKCGGMKLVAREVADLPAGSVLAVPEPAVVDTGARRVVYRESSPGVFDAVEVVLGARADGWYPVISGVAAGESVVAAGAFLVDAETRLNPAAAAAYFGATGAPGK